VLIGGITGKRGPEKETQEQRKKPRPICGEYPIVKMMIHWKHHQYGARVLLDTGCSTPLISKQIVEKMTLPCERHKQNIAIRNFTGELVPGAGQEYTIPITLQHREHYSQEVCEVATLKPEVDIFLPFWWIVKHPPQGAWRDKDLRFNSPNCSKLCTKAATTKFSLSLDRSVIIHPGVQIIGYVSAVRAADPLDQVPNEFRQFLDIMEKEVAVASANRRL